jgi:hypothetical protein
MAQLTEAMRLVFEAQALRLDALAGQEEATLRQLDAERFPLLASEHRARLRLARRAHYERWLSLEADREIRSRAGRS